MRRERRDTCARSQQSGGGARQAVAPPVWKSDPYALLEDGAMLVRVVELQGPEWVRAFQRWSLRIGCAGVDEPVDLSLFLNLAGDKAAPAVPGRQSKFYKHWTMANGEAPKNGQAMNWEVFLDKYFMAEVEQVAKDAKGQAKGEGETYSRISHFIRREDM